MTRRLTPASIGRRASAQMDARAYVLIRLSNVELSEMARNHYDVDFHDLVALDGEHERRPKLSGHHPYRTGG
jgi:hypothetical protein